MLHWQTLCQTREQLRSGERSSVDVTREMLDRVHSLNPQLKCYQVVSDDAALQQAEQADAAQKKAEANGSELGLLHGIPIGLKDLCDTAGIATSAGMALHANRIPATDATLVEKLKSAGAVVLGKLTMTEGAFATHHPEIEAPLNPWGENYWSGVSSSGSGVATAAGLCFASIGSDTLGSIRFPSAVNGVTGLKPTWGRVSRNGIFPLAPSMDHLGPMTRSAEDCAAMLAVLAGADTQDPTASQQSIPDYTNALNDSIAGLTLGLDRKLIEKGSDEPMQKAVTHVAQVLESLGAKIIEIELPSLDQAAKDGLTQCLAEVVISHEETYPALKEQYGPALAAQIESGLTVEATDLVKIAHRREQFTGLVEALFKRVDLLLLPAMNVTGPSIEEIAKQSGTGEDRLARLRFTAPFNMSRSPTLTFPAGRVESGAPVSIQLIGRHFDEARILRAAHTFQQTTDWHRQHPDF